MFPLVNRYITALISLPKSFIFCLRYFGLKRAISFPVLVSHKVWLKKMSGTVEVHRGHRVFLGFGDVGIFDFKKTRSIWEVDGSVKFLGDAKLGPGFKLSVGGICTFGEKFSLTCNSIIICKKSINFGKNNLMSWNCTVMDTDFHSIYSENVILNPDKEINIDDKVWIGCNSTILKGSYIPSGSIVASGAIVSGVLDSSNSLYGGNPLRILRRQVTWEY